MDLRNLLPMFPWEGPPLPRFTGLTWASMRSGSAGLGVSALPPILPPSSNELTTYDNLEEIELVDIDPDLLMPHKIIVHRHSKEIR